MILLRAATVMSRCDEYRAVSAALRLSGMHPNELVEELMEEKDRRDARFRIGIRRREADDAGLMARTKRRTWTD